MIKATVRCFVGTLVLFVGIGGAIAQQARYPSAAVRVLVPFTPGTVTDVVARLYSKKLSDIAGQPFVVENRPGAGGALATQVLLNAPPNGLTLLFVSSAHATTPALNSKLTYDTIKDLSGVAVIGSTPTLLVVNPSLGIKTQQQLVTLAKSRQLTYGSAGIGSAAHFACEHFAAESGTKLLHIPYKGSTEYVAEVLAGRIDLACPPIASAISQVQAGGILALSITSPQRSSLLPDVPTTSEAGVKNFEFGIWYGLVVPSTTPTNITDQLASQILAVSKEPEIAEAMTKLGIATKVVTGKGFDHFINLEIEKYRTLVKRSGIEVN